MAGSVWTVGVCVVVRVNKSQGRNCPERSTVCGIDYVRAGIDSICLICVPLPMTGSGGRCGGARQRRHGREHGDRRVDAGPQGRRC